MALILEYRYSKDEILEAYLNEIFLGQDGASAVHGFGLASEFYFGQSLKNLSLPQTASLIALVRGPSYYDPRRNPERSLERRNLVLDSMQEEGYITAQQAAEDKPHKQLRQSLTVLRIVTPTLLI
jgi:penicillin-binding protein 1B